MAENKEEKDFRPARFSWLACIYAVHHLNPYKMGNFNN